MLLVAFREDLFRHEEYQNNKIFQVFSGDNAYIVFNLAGINEHSIEHFNY